MAKAFPSSRRWAGNCQGHVIHYSMGWEWSLETAFRPYGFIALARAMATLRVGDSAPDFTATTEDGSTIQLSDLQDKKFVVLFFYPKDGTPVCTKEACSFRDSYEQFVDAGAEVIGVSSDSAASHQQFSQRYNLPFRLISDEGGRLRKLFGVPKTMGFMPGRTTYVIDNEGIVRMIYSAALASTAHVEQALEAVGASK